MHLAQGFSRFLMKDKNVKFETWKTRRQLRRVLSLIQPIKSSLLFLKASCDYNFFLFSIAWRRLI